MHAEQFVDENTIIIKTSKPSPVRPRAKRVECEKGGARERERVRTCPSPHNATRERPSGSLAFVSRGEGRN